MKPQGSGVVFLMFGRKFQERVAVAMHTLRDWWQGAVTLFVLDDSSEEIGRWICADPRIKASCVRPVQSIEGTAYVRKTFLPAWSPYERTLFIDGDCIVTGKLDELFEPSVAVTRFSNWQTQGRKVGGRIKGWLGISPYITYLAEEQLEAPQPAVNTGVLGWHHGGEWVQFWHELTKVGPKFIADEIAMQLLWSRIPGVKLFDDRYNCSAMYGINRADARVWHFHGDKHTRKEQGRALWWPKFLAALEEDVGGLKSWAGKYDPWVRDALKVPARA